jgi:hypothetical protein
MWAVILLPRWLGTSDRYRDARTSQRFRRSLRSVAQRHRSHDVAAAPGGQASRVDTSPRDSAIDRHLDLGIDPFVGTAEDGHRRRARHQQVRREARAVAASRRRRVLIGLSAAATLAVVGAVLGLVPIALAVLPAGALGGYTYLLRTQSRARRQAGRSTRGEGARPAAPESGSADPKGTWEPVAAPEPSYMRAPRATAVPRELDSTENGPWTAERMLEQAAALRSGDDVEAELGLDEYAYPQQYETARAVNE